jgi:hypothetical protein
MGGNIFHHFPSIYMNKIGGVSTPLDYKQHFSHAILYKCNIHIALILNYMMDIITCIIIVPIILLVGYILSIVIQAIFKLFS